MSDWTEYGPSDLGQAREEGRQQGLREAAEIARADAVEPFRWFDIEDIHDDHAAEREGIARAIEAKAGEK